MRWTCGNSGAGSNTADCQKTAKRAKRSASFSIVDVSVAKRHGDYIESFDERDVEAKAPASQITGHKDAIEDHKDQWSSKDAHIEAVRESVPELDERVTMLNEIRQEQHAEFMAVSQQQC